MDAESGVDSSSGRSRRGAQQNILRGTGWQESRFLRIALTSLNSVWQKALTVNYWGPGQLFPDSCPNFPSSSWKLELLTCLPWDLFLLLESTLIRDLSVAKALGPLCLLPERGRRGVGSHGPTLKGWSARGAVVTRRSG